MNSPYFLPSRYSSLEPGEGEPYAQDPYAAIRSGASFLPGCHHTDLMLLMMERYLRADAAMQDWAQAAKKCVDVCEGRMWSAQEIQKAVEEDRPLLFLNKVAPLLRLVVGYHRQNRIDARFLPTDDAASSEGVATLLTKVVKQIAINNKEHYTDAEVFMDGILTGRSYYDWRLDFERNDFGEIAGAAKDPFTIRPDPDGETYDPRKWGYVFESRWWSLDEIEFTFGKTVGALVSPLVVAGGYRGGVPSDFLDYVEEHTPWRTFGGQQGGLWQGLGSVESYIANAVDPYRKNIRVVDCQHYIRVMQRCIVNLETGDREPIPEQFSEAQIAKLMSWCAEKHVMTGNPIQSFPLRVQWRPMRRVRWTSMVGDLIVYDGWSPYESFTIVPYFPYFRRGKTRGMIEDLIDPVKELSTRRNLQIDILTRVAHSGWVWEKNSLDEEEKVKLEEHGGAAGLNLEFKGNNPPQRIEPGHMPTGIERLEQAATMDVKEIAGINDSALGQIDRVQSGRAIEARQRQSILGLEMYMDNMTRSKELVGEKKLEMIQNHYTEPRLFNIQGEDGKWNRIGINARAATGEILNNVMVGRYALSSSTTPLSDTFLASQFEELMEMVERGVLPLPMVQDIAIDLSTVPQKELIKARQNAYLKAMGFVTADEMVAMQEAGIPVNPMQIPNLAPPHNGQPGSAPAAGKPPRGEGVARAQAGATSKPPQLPPPPSR